MRIKMTSIHVTDPAPAFSFYTEVLGFQELVAMPELSLLIVQSADTGDGAGLLREPGDSPIGAAYRQGVYDAGTAAIVFGTPDVQAEYQRLTDARVRFTGPPAPDHSGTLAAVFDEASAT
ncbi:VOC family protein [Arthrobacter sp.]|uniref:VOC family protein n=1 Tax=Arthrobacter sp. TaxID=1667 RepID=UPI00339481C1